MTLDQTRLPARRVPTVPNPCLRASRLGRAALLRGTALQAAFALTVAIVPSHADAQPAPNAAPQGGQVVAGSAAIARTPGNTVITQSTDRAAIDWRSFDIGSNQAVTFRQPSAVSATLNRVTGPDPSAIAGRITANGQFILTNPNGVTFFRGAQVNAQSVIVSAPGITNQNFMAGRMVFDGKVNPNARIENAGTITVKQAGLAALVAPSVANSGTINARLGQVVLAGAAAHTLDMYGDGLVSIDVTKQVRRVPMGPDGKPVTALVTNTGAIVADGGTIQLTARAADGVVQTLVDAGGTLQANTLGAKTGQIEIAGTGGSVIIAGRIAADAPGGNAGTIVLNGSTATTLADTAHITADGRTGGGTVAIGTTLARARSLGSAPAATSARTTVAPGARVSANATTTGNGGRVTVLSTAATRVAGSFEAKGGTESGNGGTVEFSGAAGFRLTGHADTSAPHGTQGTIVLDPRDLLITSSPPSGTPNQAPATTDPNIAANAGGTTADAYVTPAQLQALTGNLHLLTTRDLTVASPLNYTAGSVVLEAGRNLSIGGNGSVAASGNLTLAAAAATVPGFDPTGAMSIAGAISGQSILLSAGTGGIAISSSVNATAVIGISTVGALTQTVGTITTPQLYGTAGSVSLAGNNAIDGVGNGTNASFQTTSGGFLLTGQPGRTLTIGSAGGGAGLFVAAGQPVTLTVDGLVLNAAGTDKAITAPGSTLLLLAADADRPFLVSATNSGVGAPVFLSLPTLSRLSVGTLQIGNITSTNGGITLGQSGEAVDLTAAGIGKLALGTRDSISQGGPLTVSDLAVSSLSGTNLSNTANRIDTLSRLGANGPTVITTAGNLALTGIISSDNATITAGGSITLGATGSLTASDSITLSAGDNAVPGANPSAAITLAGTVRAANTFNVSARNGGIALTGSAFATDLVVATPGPLTQGTTFISATSLSGRAGSVNLASTTNTIQRVDNFAVTGATGDFVLVNRDPLTVGTTSSSGISTQQGRNIILATDSLTLGTGSTSGGTALSAHGGQVDIQPYTASTPILLTTSTKPAGTLALTSTELALIDANQLTLGGINPGTGLSNTGAITLGKPGETIDLTTLRFGVLGLNTTGAVVQGGPLYVPTVTANIGSLTLDLAGNLINTASSVSATGNIALHTDGDLSAGFVNAGGNVNLSSSGPGGMTLYGDVNGQVVNLNSLSSSIANPTPSDPGIIQTGGTIVASTLTGAAGFAQLTGTNAISSLGDFVTYSGLRLTNGTTPLAVTGAVSSTTGAISLSAGGLTQTSSSSIVTPELDGSATADTVLTAPGNAVAAIGTFTQSAGSFTLATSSPTLVLGNGGGQIAATLGSLSFFANGVAIAPATRAVPALSAPSGTVDFAPYTTSRRIELIGPSAADPNALSIGPGVLSQISAQRLGLGLGRATTGPITIGNAGETIDLRTRVGSLVLQTTGAVTQGTNATLAVGLLSGTAGTLALPSATNVIAAASSLAATAGALVLQTSTDLAAANTSATGAVTLGAGGNLTASSVLSAGGALTLTAGGAVTTSASITGPTIAINAATGITQAAGSLVSTGVTTLSAPGRAITQTGGTIAASNLVTTSATLSLPGANSLPAASITATGAVTLNDTVALTLTTLSATNATVATAAGLTLNGGITASGTLTLRAGGAITQPGGTVTTGALSTISSAQTTLGQQNAIATLASASSIGGLTIVDAGALTVTRAVVDPTSVNLRTGGDLALSGPITTGAFAVAVGGALVQTAAGPITAASLAGTAASVSLPAPNLIAALGTFTTTGSFALTDAAALTITGAVSAGSPTGPAQTISLVTAGALVETAAGALVATTLTGSAATASLTGGNQIVTLGAFSTTGDLTFANRGDLGVAGPVTGANISLSSTGSMALSGNVTSPGLTTLTAGAAITQPGGIVTTNQLSLTSSTTTTLGQQNAIATLAAASSSGGLTVVDAGALTVTGPVADRTAVTIRTGGALTLAGPITTDTFTVAAGGALTQTAGAITATSLGGTAGSAAFTQPNAIATLTGFTTAGSFALTDSTALTIAGAVTAGTGQTIALTTGTLTFGPGAALIAPGGTVSLAEFTPGLGITLAGNTLPVTAARLSIGSPTAGPITITGVFDLPGGTLDLQSGAAITETAAGAVRAAALTGRGSDATLTGANQIGALGSFATTGNLTFANAADLAVTGPITAANVTLSSTGALTFSGTVATPGALTLTAAGAIAQTGGALTAASLTGSANSVALTAPNAIAALGNFTTAGSFALSDAAALAVTGAVTAGAGQTIALRTDALTFGPGSALIVPGGAITLAEVTPGVGIALSGSPSTISADTVTLGSATGGSLTIAGFFDVPGIKLDLQSAGTIRETGAGAIRAAGLTGRAAAAALTGANQIGTIGPFATTGDFTFANATDLAVAGPITGGNITLSSAGNLALAGTLATPGTLTLTAGGAITQPGGFLSAAALTGSAFSAILDRSANTVTNLAGFTTTGDFTYANNGDLTVTALVDPNTVTINVAGRLTIASVIAGTNVVLNARDGITETVSGQVIATSLSGSAESAVLASANQVDTIADFATTNGFALNTTRALAVTGPLTDQRGGVSLTAPSIDLAGPLSAPSLTFATPGALSQSGGPMAIGTLTGTANSIDLGNRGPASIGTLGAVDAATTLAINDGSALRIAGPVSAPALTIAATGALVLDGGAIRTDGQPFAAQLGANPAAGGSNLAVRPGASGTASLVQLGTTTVTSLSGGSATLRFDLPAAGGTLLLNDLQAANARVVLSLGSGDASGTLNVSQLAVLGSGGRADLTGQIGTRADPTAAQLAQLLPGSDLRYTFNQCAIASVTCSSDTIATILFPSAAISSILRPDILTLDVLDLTVTRDRDDPTLLLPNISDRDY